MNSNPSKNEIEFVRDALMQYNNGIVGNDNHSPLNMVEYDKDGNVIGGIIGGTYWGWMYIEILWVHENHRRTGIGSKLLSEGEKETRKNGTIYLDTIIKQDDRCRFIHTSSHSDCNYIFYKAEGVVDYVTKEVTFKSTMY